MSFTDYFIKKPVLAIVINLLILVSGFLSISSLTLREYPEVSSPIYNINITYPNASADVMETEVATPLEDTLGGVEGLEEITSSSSYGWTKIRMKFKAGTDLGKAQSGIRDGLALTRGNLPQDINEPVVQQGDTDTEAFIFLSLTSDQATFAELTHMANLYLKNPIKTIAGVSKVEVWGQPYEMKIRLDPNKMLAHNIDAFKVYEILQGYNATLPGGQYQEALPITIDMTASEVKDFEKIPVLHHGRSIVLLKDIADIRLESSTKSFVRLNGKPAVFLGIQKTSDGNPLEIAETIKKRIPDFEKALPSHVKLEVSFDKTLFIKGSLKAVEWSIAEAIVLVMIIVFLFLRNLRSILIPVVAIPLSLIGVMSIMAVAGLSINTITLLAMVLAVGLVVDDAIVVLENIHRHIEGGMTPKEAAFQGAREIGFAIIAMTLTLASVYAPVAFIQDTIGQVFFEFALTLAGSVIISGIVALTFSPLMCSVLLKPHEHHYFPSLDLWLDKLDKSYQTLLTKVFQWPKLLLTGIAVIMVGCVSLYGLVPRALTPVEDRGVIGAFMPAVANMSQEELDTYVRQVESAIAGIPEVPSYLTFSGNWGCNVVSAIKPWDERNRSSAELVNVLRERVSKIPTLPIWPWSWDTGIPGVEQISERGGGIPVILQTTGSYTYLNGYAEKLNEVFNNDKAFFLNAHHDLKLSAAGFDAKINRLNLALSGISARHASIGLMIMMDENAGLEFRKDGVRYTLALSGQEKPFYLEEVFAFNNENKMVPFSDFMTLVPNVMPKDLKHFKQMRSAGISVTLAPHIGMEQGMKEIEKRLAEVLPNNVRYEFSGEAKKLQESSSMMLMLILIALFFIFCIMAIQFESFIDPLIIMFTVPLAGFGALGLVWITGGNLDIYTQVGLITLIGLISKHGILIVEFANQQIALGIKLQEAISKAAMLRLRPILMTTGAMVFGALPLILSSGAGAETRRAIGIVLVGGLSVGTLLTLFVIPMVYLQVKTYLKKK